MISDGLFRCVTLLPPPDDVAFLRAIHSIYLQFSKFPEALSVAVRLNDAELIRQDFNASGNPSVTIFYTHFRCILSSNTSIMRRQLALLLSRAQIPLEWLQPPASEDADAETELPEDIVECLSNTHLSRFFREFGKEVGVAEPKSLEDVYKSHLENTRKYMSSRLDQQEHIRFVNRRRLVCERRLCPRKPGWYIRQRICQRRVWK